jgi:hypothetical protein
MRAGNRSDLAVKLADRTARSAACSGDGGVYTGRGAIKGQGAITEVFVQQANVSVGRGAGDGGPYSLREVNSLGSEFR